MSITKRASRWLNLLVTGEPCMLCATAYHRQWPVCRLFDKMLGRHHCKQCFDYEKLHNKSYILHLYELAANKPLPVLYRCDKCQRIVENPTKVSRIIGGSLRNYEFCSDDCADEHIMRKLREAGL